ncbi:MAG: hypothetical protein QNI91_07555 [Arenicellales bacterium]|nr:hypothetical protein [Arenicellales bacterium]
MRTIRIITTAILLGVFTLSNAQEITPNPEAEIFLESSEGMKALNGLEDAIGNFPSQLGNCLSSARPGDICVLSPCQGQGGMEITYECDEDLRCIFQNIKMCPVI